MTTQLPTVMVCGEYQKLFEESTVAREAWSPLRAKICWARLVPKETVDELQAKYARAYAFLRRHVPTCGRCMPLLKTA